MRELELLISEAFKAGLSPEAIVPPNAPVLRDCIGFRCGKAWLEGYKALSNPLIMELDYSWPFPQFLTDESKNILVIRDDFAAEDRVYEVSDDHLTVTHIFTIDQLTFGKGGLMDLVDFGKYAFLTNGVAMLHYDVDFNTWAYMAPNALVPLMGTLCNFNGQAVGGCVLSAWHGCDETYIIWGKIGSFDFTPDEMNTAGFRRDPYGGEVYNVRSLGDKVIVFSSKGVSFMTPHEVSFGFSGFSNIGLVNKGAVDGNKSYMMWVDNNYDLWFLHPKGNALEPGAPKNLGYQQYMKLLAGEDIIVRFDELNNNFYIGNSEKTFLFSMTGLTEVTQHPSAVWTIDKESYIIPDEVDVTFPKIRTEKFDMGLRGQKTIFTIEADINVEGVEAFIEAKIGNTFSTTTPYVMLNNQGVVSSIISGTDFTVGLLFDHVDENTIVNYLKVRYKMTDIRSIRGVYAPPPRGQVQS